MNGLRMIFGLFTTIPMGKFEFQEKVYQKWLWALSLVGLVLSGGVFLIAQLPIRQPLLGILVLLGYIILTGGLHMDGFGDTLDGLLSRREKERALEIMRDPHLGTFGILGIIFYLLLMAACLVSPITPWAYLFPLVGRLMAFVMSYRKTPARPDGLGNVFLTGAQPMIGWTGLAVLIGLLVILKAHLATGGIFITFLVGLLIERWIHRRLGGMTGDTIGFGIEYSQLIYLLVLSIGA